MLLGDLADVPDEMGREVVGGVLPGRHLLDDDVGQLETPRDNRGHLGRRGILDEHNRPVPWRAPVTRHRFTKVGLVDPDSARQ